MECEAVKHVRNKMNLKNADLMVLFIRKTSEMKIFHQILKENVLEQKKDDLRVMNFFTSTFIFISHQK